MIALALALLAGAAIFLSVREVHERTSRRRQLRRSMRMVRQAGGPTTPRAEELGRTFSDRVVVPGLMRIGGFARRLTPLSAVDRLRTQLTLAGNPPAWDAERILALKLVGAGAGPAIVLVLGTLTTTSGLKRVIFAAAVGALGWFLPDALVGGRARRRQEELRRALPDTLDLLAISVEAGLGFDAAMGRVVSRSSGPLAEEMTRTLREMQLGRSRADALRDLGDRSAVAEMRSFCQAMVQAESFGASVSKVLQVQAHELRTKRRQRAEEQAQKIPVKIVFPVLFCIFPALFVVLLGPGVINIWRALFS